MEAHSTIDISVAGQNRTLEARLCAGGPSVAVVAPPHPKYGGDIDNPVVHALALGFGEGGRGTLTFNWQGVGGSGGEITGDLFVAITDYQSALTRALSDTGGHDELGCIAAGYSFGAGTALSAAAMDSRVDRLLLVAPPVAMLQAVALEQVHKPVHVLVGDADEYAPLDAVRAAVERLPKGELQVLDGVDHFFMGGGLDAVRRAAAQI